MSYGDPRLAPEWKGEHGKGVDEFEFYISNDESVKEALKYRWWETEPGWIEGECERPKLCPSGKHTEAVIFETISALTGKRVNYIEII